MSGTIAVETHREGLHLVLIHAHIHLLEDIFILILFVTLNVNSSENFNTVPPHQCDGPLSTWPSTESPRKTYWVNMGACWEGVSWLLMFNDVGRSSPLWAASFPRYVFPRSWIIQKSRWAQASEHVCTDFSLILGVNAILPRACSVASLPRGTITWKSRQKQTHFSPKLLFTGMFYHSSRNKTGTNWNILTCGSFCTRMCLFRHKHAISLFNTLI